MFGSLNARAFLMAIKTYTEQLEAVQTAIAKIEAGAQSYSVEGNAFTRADLATLYKRETEIRALVAREGRGGGIRMRQGVPR